VPQQTYVKFLRLPQVPLVLLTMFSSQLAVLLALAINFRHVKGLMVESIDGSFVPWSFVKRAPGDAIAVRMKNNFDQAYLVSSYHYASLLVADQSYRQLFIWVSSRFAPCPSTLSHSVIISCDRHSSSTNLDGRFSLAELHLSWNASERCR
jgi:hypothetical protein